MPDVRVPESTADRHVGLTYVDAPVNYLADLSVKPVTYNPPLGTGLPRTLSEVGVGRDRFREIAEKSMHDRAVLNNPRPINGPAEVMEILELAA